MPGRLQRKRFFAPAEMLESRRLMCVTHTNAFPAPVEIGTGDTSFDLDRPAAANDPANIDWTNRNDPNNGFNATFGTSATAAKNVVDSVIVAFERMIGSFNYPTSGQKFDLSLSMSGGGFGASAGMTLVLNGIPKSGVISMGTGNNSANANDSNGWFLDPTPNDHSEFLGTITNAFALDAHGGSPASGLGDFYTVVAAEVTHTLGLYGSLSVDGNLLPGWIARTTNTGISDTAEGGGIGTFYAFQGPSIKHLLTSNNGGPGGNVPGGAIHGAGPNVNVNFGGDIYTGAQDHGNAQYEFGRRYMVNNTFALMFKDAYGYSTVNPANFGTAYSVLNESTGQVTVRGGSSTSADNITISTTGSKVTISVDIGNDVAGTGALPGAGNLPAFVTEYDISQISSISISAGEGNDVINLNSIDNATPISVVADNSGNDTVNIGSGVYTNLQSNVTVSGGGGVDTVVIDDTLDTGNDTYNYSGTSFSKPGSATTTLVTVENVTLKTNGFDNTINITGVSSGAPLNVLAGNGNDIINVGSTNISSILAILTIEGGGQTDALNILDPGFASAANYTINSGNIARSNNPVSINYATLESLAITGGSGGNTYNITNTAVSVPVTITTGSDTDTVNVNETASNGAVTLATSTLLDQVNVNTDNTGSATVHFSGVTRLGALNIGDGGLVSLQLAGQQAISATSLSFNGTGKLDLSDDGFVLDYPATSLLETTQPAILSGYAGGAWIGPGIGSSLAASTLDRAVGYGEASDLGLAGANFLGITPDVTSLVFRYTVLADASLDGVVGSTDFNAFAGGYGLSSASPRPTWAQGNFDFDEKVNTIDFNILAGQFGIVLPGPLPGASLSGIANIPTPALFSNQPLGEDPSIDLLA